MNEREKCLREACEIVKKWDGESDDSNRENLVRAN